MRWLLLLAACFKSGCPAELRVRHEMGCPECPFCFVGVFVCFLLAVVALHMRIASRPC